MDHTALREREFEVDLESGGTTSSEEDVSNSLGAKRQAQIFLDKVYHGFIAGSVKGDNGVMLCGSISNSSGVLAEHMKFLSDESMEGKDVVNSAVKNSVKEKCKKTSNKKSQKPPRPPRGPSLDAADHKLIKEISELVMLKRAKIERMKALKKMKAAKPSSTSNSNLYAMVFTILFCLVIFLQGMSSQTSSPLSSQESSTSAGVGGGDLISVQYFRTPMANNPNGLASDSPNLVEEVAGLDPAKKLSRDAG